MHMSAGIGLPYFQEMYGREVARVHNCTFQHLSAIYDSVLRGGGVVVSKSCADFLSNTTIPAPPDSNSAYKIIENMGELTTVSILRAYVPYVTAVKDIVAASATHCVFKHNTSEPLEVFFLRSNREQDVLDEEQSREEEQRMLEEFDRMSLLRDTRIETQSSEEVEPDETEEADNVVDEEENPPPSDGFDKRPKENNVVNGKVTLGGQLSNHSYFEEANGSLETADSTEIEDSLKIKGGDDNLEIYSFSEPDAKKDGNFLEKLEGFPKHGDGWPKEDQNLGADVINFGVDEIGESESPPDEDEHEWCPKLFPMVPLPIAAPPMEDGDIPKLNSDNHQPEVMDGFDITRISLIDPFWPREEKERSFNMSLFDKNKSNHSMVPTNTNNESLPMDRPIPSRPTISPVPTMLLHCRSPGSATSTRFGNNASWRDNDETDGSAGLRAIGIG
ncbi:hypothetical protein CCACVL1_28868 [Corchorus capsularis]|uniref:Uncharacterized protein n=1 Tax=Corchorus capsularis TaxID=210143 RepID=A0A1R3G4X3_COCAP|nr:hypothetical protein CCACVL1_28868 [Corchorus capsularis]